jgi:hypothetical protein
MRANTASGNVSAEVMAVKGREYSNVLVRYRNLSQVAYLACM